MAATNRKSYYGLSNGAIFNDLEQPLTQFSRLLYLTLNIIINGTIYRHIFNDFTNSDLRPTQQSFRFDYLE